MSTDRGPVVGMGGVLVGFEHARWRADRRGGLRGWNGVHRRSTSARSLRCHRRATGPGTVRRLRRKPRRSPPWPIEWCRSPVSQADSTTKLGSIRVETGRLKVQWSRPSCCRSSSIAPRAHLASTSAERSVPALVGEGLGGMLDSPGIFGASDISESKADAAIEWSARTENHP